MPGLDFDVPEGKDDQIAFYKAQVQELEDQLAEFQASSTEIEKELEKELESNERQIRELRSKNEALRYEVDEWKVRLLPSSVLSLLVCSAAYQSCLHNRENASNRDRKQTMSRTLCRRRSPHCATLTVICN
jgi:DNA repair exonuclease SbcCD ATPase subunit